MGPYDHCWSGGDEGGNRTAQKLISKVVSAAFQRRPGDRGHEARNEGH